MLYYLSLYLIFFLGLFLEICYFAARKNTITTGPACSVVISMPIERLTPGLQTTLRSEGPSSHPACYPGPTVFLLAFLPICQALISSFLSLCPFTLAWKKKKKPIDRYNKVTFFCFPNEETEATEVRVALGCPAL